MNGVHVNRYLQRFMRVCARRLDEQFNGKKLLHV